MFMIAYICRFIFRMPNIPKFLTDCWCTLSKLGKEQVSNGVHPEEHREDPPQVHSKFECEETISIVKKDGSEYTGYKSQVIEDGQLKKFSHGFKVYNSTDNAQGERQEHSQHYHYDAGVENNNVKSVVSEFE